MAQTASHSAGQVLLHRKIGIVKKRKAMPRQKWPAMIEAEYAKAIINMLARSKAGILEVVKSLPPLIASAAVGRERTDADEGRRARELVDAARTQMRQVIQPNEIDKLAEKFGQRTANYHKSELAQQVKATFGIDIHYVDRPGARISNFAAESVSHIQSIPERLHDSVAKLVTRGISEGMTHDELAGHIEKAYSVGETDARRIARDQIGKLYGALNADRQQSMGVNRFIWRTAGDERVREEHEALNGQEFSYDEGGDDEEGLPGEPIQCRCYAEPVLDDILGETEEEPTPEEQPEEQPADAPPAPTPPPDESPVEEEEPPTDLEVPEGYVSLPHFEEELGIDAKQMRAILRKLDIPKPSQGWSWSPEEAAAVKEKIIAAAGKKIKAPAVPAAPPLPAPVAPAAPVAAAPVAHPTPYGAPLQPVVHPPHVIAPPVPERPKDEPPPIPKARVRNPRTPKPIATAPAPGFTSGTSLPSVVVGKPGLPSTANIKISNVTASGRVGTGRNSIDPPVQREIRVVNNKLVAQYNFPNKEVGARNAFRVVVQSDRQMGNALASHSSGDSQVTLAQDTATRYSSAIEFLNQGGDFRKARAAASPNFNAEGVSPRDLVDRQIQALKTVTHETIHGHGPPNGYEGHGVFVEEVTTESAARRITRESLGFANHEAEPALRDGSGSGSYGRMIQHTASSIGDVLEQAGVPASEYERMVGDMAMRYKSYSVNPFRDPASTSRYSTSDESLKLMAHCVDFKGEAAKSGMNLSDEQVSSMKATLIQKLSSFQVVKKR